MITWTRRHSSEDGSELRSAGSKLIWMKGRGSLLRKQRKGVNMVKGPKKAPRRGRSKEEDSKEVSKEKSKEGKDSQR